MISRRRNKLTIEARLAALEEQVQFTIPYQIDYLKHLIETAQEKPERKKRKSSTRGRATKCSKRK